MYALWILILVSKLFASCRTWTCTAGGIGAIRPPCVVVLKVSLHSNNPVTMKSMVDARPVHAQSKQVQRGKDRFFHRSHSRQKSGQLMKSVSICLIALSLIRLH